MSDNPILFFYEKFNFTSQQNRSHYNGLRATTATRVASTSSYENEFLNKKMKRKIIFPPSVASSSLIYNGCKINDNGNYYSPILIESKGCQTRKCCVNTIVSNLPPHAEQLLAE